MKMYIYLLVHYTLRQKYVKLNIGSQNVLLHFHIIYAYVLYLRHKKQKVPEL